MGLFSKKDPCAICGGNVKGLLPKKIEGQYVCSDCYGQVDLPEGMVESMSVESFKEYMAFREENRLLKDQFETTNMVDFGWLDDKFVFDSSHRFFCMDKSLNKTIFQGSRITRFAIKEDEELLFEGSPAGLVRYASKVPDRVMALAPLIDQFYVKKKVERILDRYDDDEYNPELHFSAPKPVENFLIEIYMEHPYWSIYTADMMGPSFSPSNPDTRNYLEEYRKNAATMEELAWALMSVAFPGVGEAAPGTTIPAGQSTQMTGSIGVNAVEEIKKFKELLDMGIITEEEFAAKKQQLLGL